MAPGSGELKAGDLIQDTYEVISQLGEGGMGATYKGRNIATGHAVAIKVMTPEFSRNSKAEALFKRESSLLRTVQNEAVIRYETTLKDAEGRFYLVMEYVEGKPLSHYISRGARLAPEDVLKLGKRLAGGIAALHKFNIIHRDIAPDNIMVPDDDIMGAKLIDFGLASDTVGTEKSIIGDSFAGKFSYSAPEQLGLFGAKVTPATDVYALGLVLMKIAGLSVPGEGMGAAALDARRNDLKIVDKKVPAELARVLEAMLRADPADRPADISAIFASGVSASAAAEPVAEPAKRGIALPLALGGIASAALAAGIWFFFIRSDLPTTGASITQAETANEALAADDPLASMIALIDKGGSDNLNAAFGALMAYGNDKANADTDRRKAYVMVAQMYDPDTYDATRSPFPGPNATAARRFYQRAADLGSDDAVAALERLGE
jgi:serine/threonine-protein kinase